jgi:pilus assembly protein Flp/PilA
MMTIRKMFRDKKGATAIEYGLIAALIAVAAITAMSSLGDQLDTTFQGVSDNLEEGNADLPTG